MSLQFTQRKYYFIVQLNEVWHITSYEPIIYVFCVRGKGEHGEDVYY